jgi:uncharacterized protein YjbI with pentapeptide repeats
MKSRANRKYPILILVSMAVVGFLYTNAISTKTLFDEETMSCVGLSPAGRTIGMKTDTTELKNCSRTQGLVIQAKDELANLKGADVFNARINSDAPLALHATASNFFSLDADGKQFNEVQLKRTSFVEPKWKSIVFSNGTMESTQFIGSRSIDANALESVDFENIKFSASIMENLTWNNGTIKKVIYQGQMSGLQISKFTAHASTFNEVKFADVNFKNSRFFDLKIEKSSVCGNLKFDGGYFSRSTIELSGESACSHSTLVSFNESDLKHSKVSIQPNAKMAIDFSGAQLQGTDLSGLDLRGGRWAFQGAQVDQFTKLPENFAFKNQLVFSKSVAGVK